jgi:catechol 2,3-dioxygenase-like lactoylglutathione lyase family enzyme
LLRNTDNKLSVPPSVGARDLERALRFYIDRFGFSPAFRDGSDPTNYAGLRRDGVELHFQYQDADEMGTIRLRFLVDDPDALFAEYQDKQVLREGTRVSDTAWGTREFAFYDLDGNALTFYKDLPPQPK